MPEEVVFTMSHEKRKKMEGTAQHHPQRGDFKADNSTEIYRLSTGGNYGKGSKRHMLFFFEPSF